MEAIKKAGRTPAPFIPGQFLLDTGASGTCIDPSFIAKLGLTSTGFVDVHTPSTAGTPVRYDQYDVSLFVPAGPSSLTGYYVPALPVIATELVAQGIEGLLGRDVLDRCVLVYNGSINTFTLSY